MSEQTRPAPAPAADDGVQADDVGEIIRIVDPEIDVDAIVAEIKANLSRRPKLDPDPSSLVYRPGDAMAQAAQSELEWLVDQATEAQRGLVIGDQLRPSPGVVGQVATRVKRPLHQLARFYVELLARKQSALDDHLIRALGILAQRSSAQQDDVAALRREIEALRRELAELRGELPAPSPSERGLG